MAFIITARLHQKTGAVQNVTWSYHGSWRLPFSAVSFLPTLGEANEAVTPSFPNPRQQLASCSVFCVILYDTASRQFTAVVEPKAI